MSLSHVYIVLEPVGSARLTFGDDRCEFMCFDVPKVVPSPGCDHGHDEESRNGRDMKIDILDDYIRTPKWFRGLSDIYRSTGCWKYALEAIIKWLLLYFLVHDNCLLFML